MSCPSPRGLSPRRQNSESDNIYRGRVLWGWGRWEATHLRETLEWSEGSRAPRGRQLH